MRCRRSSPRYSSRERDSSYDRSPEHRGDRNSDRRPRRAASSRRDRDHQGSRDHGRNRKRSRSPVRNVTEDKHSVRASKPKAAKRSPSPQPQPQPAKKRAVGAESKRTATKEKRSPPLLRKADASLSPVATSAPAQKISSRPARAPSLSLAAKLVKTKKAKEEAAPRPAVASKTRKPWSLPAAKPRKWCSGDVGQFKIIDKVGEGTYGEVFKAQNLSTGTLVALKKIRMDEKNEREGFPITAIREVQILKELTHHSIVSLKGIVSESSESSKGQELLKFKGAFFMVFEYMQHDLTGILEGGLVKLTPKNIRGLMRSLVEGLDYCHQRGMLHRDIKVLF